MSIRKKTQHGFRGGVALGFTFLLLASACGSPDEPFAPGAGDTGTTPSPVTPGSDAGSTTTVPQQDGGGVLTPADAGTSTPPTDAQVPARDGSTAADASLDGGSSDGGSLGDASFDGGGLDGGSLDGGSLDGGSLDGGSLDGGSLDGGSAGDASLNDGSAGDAGLNDGSVGDAAVADAQTDANTPRPDLGKGNGKDVIVIGDSWMEYSSNNGGIQAALDRAAGQTYRKYAKAGAKLFKDGTGLVSAPAIPKQYATAKGENPNIKTVVMTGGGNDVLLEDSIDDCGTTNPGPKCREQINKMAETLRTLWQQMGADGVKDVIYIEYSSKVDNSGAVLLGAEKIAPICAAASPVRCHFIAADDHMGRAQLLNPDLLAALIGAPVPIHPNEEGCKIMAKAAYDRMVSEGMRR